MFLTDLLFALVIGLLLTGLFNLLFRNRGPWGLWWVFLIVVFFATWAGGVWVTPFGPIWFGVAWLPFLLIGFLVALLLAAATPTQLPRTRSEAIAQAEAESAGAVALSVFFWVLLIGFIGSIIIAYV
jgi:hypothetical protein